VENGVSEHFIAGRRDGNGLGGILSEEGSRENKYSGGGGGTKSDGTEAEDNPTENSQGVGGNQGQLFPPEEKSERLQQSTGFEIPKKTQPLPQQRNRNKTSFCWHKKENIIGKLGHTRGTIPGRPEEIP